MKADINTTTDVLRTRRRVTLTMRCATAVGYSSVLWLAGHAFLGAQTSGNVPAGRSQSDELHQLAVEQNVLLDPVTITGRTPTAKPLVEVMQTRSVPGMSVAIIDNYRILWARGYGVSSLATGNPVTPKTRFNAGSISKLVTAVTVLRLVEQGRLSLDADVRRAMPMSSPRELTAKTPALTVRQVLSHSSGIDGHFSSSYPMEAAMPSLAEILQSGMPSKAPAQTAPSSDPPSRFEYSSRGFTVLQVFLEQRFGQSFGELVRQQIFVPLHLSDSSYEQSEASWSEEDRARGHVRNSSNRLYPVTYRYPELAASGLWSTPTDLATLLIAIQRSASPGGFLSPDSFRLLTVPTIANASLGAFVAGDAEGHFMRIRASDGLPQDAYAGWLTAATEGGNGAVIMTNNNALLPGFALLRSIAREYHWRGYLTERPAVAIAPGDLAQYVGTYGAAGEVLTFSMDGSSMAVSIEGGPRQTVLPMGNDSFFINRDMLYETVFTFRSLHDGKMAYLDCSYPGSTLRAYRQ